jgi:hypothetical protein
MLRYDGGCICRSSDHKFLKTILTDARFVALLIGDKVKYRLGKKCLTAPACAMWLTRNVAAVVVLAAERAVFRFPCRLFHISHHFFCKGFFSVTVLMSSIILQLRTTQCANFLLNYIDPL